jgi:hypothetical protein
VFTRKGDAFRASGEGAHDPTAQLIAVAVLLAFVARFVAEHFHVATFGIGDGWTHC